jgi:Family of unknown function (DUF695)/Regulator of ribonuclease activity B
MPNRLTLHLLQNPGYMSKVFTAVLAIFLPVFLLAQEENWDVYMAKYKSMPSSVTLNMAMKSVAPVKTLPFVVITGVSFKNCDADGMPSKREFSNLYKISDSLKTIMDRVVTNKLTGSFTYLCQRLDYFYVSDTVGLRQQLAFFYREKFPQYRPHYINIKEDKTWAAYLDFLYPNEESYEFMQNQRLVTALQNGGDKLIKERLVDHWLYFKTDIDRNCFITYATKQKFIVISKERSSDPKAPFKLHIARTNKVDVASISKITIELRKQAKKCNGEYDGWETFVVK